MVPGHDLLPKQILGRGTEMESNKIDLVQVHRSNGTAEGFHPSVDIHALPPAALSSN